MTHAVFILNALSGSYIRITSVAQCTASWSMEQPVYLRNFIKYPRHNFVTKQKDMSGEKRWYCHSLHPTLPLTNPRLSPNLLCCTRWPLFWLSSVLSHSSGAQFCPKKTQGPSPLSPSLSPLCFTPTAHIVYMAALKDCLPGDDVTPAAVDLVLSSRPDWWWTRGP